jgi:hypothetical protein
MKSFRSYLRKLDRSATARPHQRDRNRLFKSILATTFVAGSQFVSAISATANPVPTPAAPSTILPNRSLFNGNFAQPAVTGWTGTPSISSWPVPPAPAPALSSTKGSAGTNIAGANVREAYLEPVANPAAAPIIWRSTESENNRPTPTDPEAQCRTIKPNGSRRDSVCFVDAIEVWKGTPTGNGSPTSLAPGTGQQYAELNGSDNAALYQDICVMPSELINWSLYHSARNLVVTNPTNIMQVSITDPAGWVGKTPPVAQPNAYYSSLGRYSTSGLFPGTQTTVAAGDPVTAARPFIATPYSDGWKNYTGSWTSTNTTAKLMRFAFGAVQGSGTNRTIGNFITGVSLNLSPLVDFLPSDISRNVNVSTTAEGNPSSVTPPYYYLSLRVNGRMSAAGQVQIAMSGLNASRTFRIGTVLKGSAAATGLTASASGGLITLNIPAGTYNPNVPTDYIHIPIDFSDTTGQANDNLTFTLNNVSGGNVTVGSTECNSTRLTLLTSLVDDDGQRRVELPVRVATSK